MPPPALPVPPIGGLGPEYEGRGVRWIGQQDLVERTQPPLSYPCNARHIFSGVRGVSMWRTPAVARASRTALATATGEGTVETEPTPLDPRGLVGEGVSMFSMVRSGIAAARGRA